MKLPKRETSRQQREKMSQERRVNKANLKQKMGHKTMARRRVMVEQIKDTIRSVDHITTPLAGKTKVTASTTAQYVEEKSAQAKNATVGSMEKTTEDAKGREKAGTKGQIKKVKLNKN